ncbi:Cytidine deaminase [Borrelia miyamotoi]|uniref:Cytidine deaminase n=1 Tax=Borrelia miyamotoi TaxID=47466 RepID=A0AAP8YRJ8_9SPIR|nr:cytidine deaminase [Borrelia miyamotoi]AHH04795.1 Cytidine deaminase [Borrelia miyamotoi FR64b]ATQ14634.1 cytidine deaminase [Borrelia miyamotoi]ATQ15819.1 cytidine deaminase [Borrelia miyamotoi]ATQ16963.1 cytidine deaminase [Borrelia miyamotoi]ATQ18532.1 cytidine deaminase [Borrelia miyamotoi]
MENNEQRTIEKAFQLAEAARNNAYSPYSQFKVGACIKTKENLFFQGSNVENASFGATRCAEQAAIMNMISSVSTQKIDFIMITTIPASVPCAICRQVMSEFFEEDTKILITDPNQFKVTKKVSQIYTLKDLLKVPFNKEELSRIFKTNQIT